MTESKKIYRKSRRNKAFAAVLAGVTIVGSGYLIFAVNTLEQKYGRIADDLVYSQTQLASTRESMNQVREEFQALSDQKVNLTSDVSQAEVAHRSLIQREADAQARLNAAQESLTSIQEELAAAEETIATAGRLSRENANAQSRQQSLIRDIARLEGEMEDITQKRIEAETLHDQVQDTLERAEGQRDDLLDQVADLEPKVSRLKADEETLSRLQDEQVRLVTQVDNLRSTESDLRSEIASQTERKAQADQELADATGDLKVAETELEEVRSSLDVAQDRKTEIDARMAGAMARAEEHENRANLAEERLQNATARLETVSSALKVAQEDFAPRSAQLSQLRTQIERAQTTIAELEAKRQQVAILDAEVTRLQASKAALQEQLPDLEATAQSARVEIATLSGQLQTLTQDVSGQRENLSEVRALIARLDDEAARTSDRRDTLVAQTVEAEETAAQSQVTIQTLEAEHGRLTAAIKGLEQRREAISEEVLRRERQLQQIDERLRSAATGDAAVTSDTPAQSALQDATQDDATADSD